MTGRAVFLRRGPLDRRHADAGAELMPVADAGAPCRYPRPAATSICALADLSALARTGFKGWRVWSVLADAGTVCPHSNNTATEQGDGGLCLRLGDREALMLGSLISAAASPEAFTLTESEGFYPVPRRETHAWLLLLGSTAPQLLAKLCAVDLRLHKFSQFQVAQTHVAGASAVIARGDLGNVPAFHLLTDTTMACYLWSAVLAAGREYDARPTGLESLQPYAQAARARRTES